MNQMKDVLNLLHDYYLCFAAPYGAPREGRDTIPWPSVGSHLDNMSVHFEVTWDNKYARETSFQNGIVGI